MMLIISSDLGLLFVIIINKHYLYKNIIGYMVIVFFSLLMLRASFSVVESIRVEKMWYWRTD
jgi:hypothetical protein